MSGTLLWRPPRAWKPVEKADTTLRDTLKGHEVLNASDLQFLSGMAAGGVPGANYLIEMIEKYEEIELKVEY